MPFDTTPVSNERYTRDQGTLVVEWDSTLGDHAVYQVYANGELVWSGTGLLCILPYPNVWTFYEVGAVDPEEVGSDLSASLSGPLNRPHLTWTGGTYQSEAILGYAIYGEDSPGAGINYSERIGFVPAGAAGVILSGYGDGGYGDGGYGGSGQDYEWTGSPYGPGTWTFGVQAIDLQGREIPGGYGMGGYGTGGYGGTTGSTVDITIVGPPRPPADLGYGRLSIFYDDSTQVATLTWNASLL
jgi:hypothetical protein